MRDVSSSTALSTLRIDVEVDPQNPDRAEVTLLVDGRRPFDAVRPGWRGLDPDDLLGEDPPLLPADPGRRTALGVCSCGESGCGAAAAVIAEADGVVTWSDVRAFTGVFVTALPLGDEDPAGGTVWDVPLMRFDTDRYRAEVTRAAADRSWESARRVTARLLRPQVERAIAHAETDVVGVSVRPMWRAEGLALTLTHRGAPDARTWWEYLHLPAPCVEPQREADGWGALLAGSDPSSWSDRFGYDPAEKRRREREQPPTTSS